MDAAGQAFTDAFGIALLVAVGAALAVAVVVRRSLPRSSGEEPETEAAVQASASTPSRAPSSRWKKSHTSTTLPSGSST